MKAVSRAMLDEVLAAALEYARRGKPVFPCSASKQPLTERGFYDATTDEAQISAWWSQWPGALIGMPTGARSGVVVIDLDVREGYDGSDAWASLQEGFGTLPDTVESLTAGGGRHLFFKHPGFPVRNSASKLGLGIDVRGDGGYVVIPPSVLPDGRRYEWEGSNPERPAELPAWTLRLLGQRVEPREVKDPPSEGGATSGQRNVYLASVAGRLAHAGMSKSQIRAMLLAENDRACSPPLPAEEIEKTVLRSAAKWVETEQERERGPSPQDPEEARVLRWAGAGEWARTLKAPAWIIEDYLERGTFNVTIGGWGSGKSAVELDRALRCAEGMAWHGKTLEPIVWVYVAGEAQRGLQRRVAAWGVHHGVIPNDRMVVIPEAVLLGQADHEAALAQALDAIQQERGEAISVVTLDTMARCFGLEDENSNSDVTRWVNSIQGTIVDVTGAAVSVLHHPGHGDKTRGRGASALPGATDMEWLIERTGYQVTLRCTKSKDADFPDPLGWELTGVSLEAGGASFTAPVVEECTVAPAMPRGGSKQEQALSVLRAMYVEARAHLSDQGRGAHEARVDRGAWRGRCEAEGIVSGKNARQQFNRLVDELRGKGSVTEEAPWIYPAAPVGASE